MSGGAIFLCCLAGYFAGAMLTAYICGRWRFGEFHSTNNILVWPLALPVLLLMWAYSRGERHWMLTALIMLTSVGILIAFGDWIYRNMPDALDNSARKLSDGGNTQAALVDRGGKVNPSAAETRTDKGDTAHRDLGPSR